MQTRLTRFGLIMLALAFRRPLAAQPLPTLSINDVSLAEDSCQNKSFVFTVTLSRLESKAVTVNYATSDGTATANNDYVPVSGTLTSNDHVPNGPRGSHLLTIAVPLGNFVNSAPAGTFTVTLSGAANATIDRAQGVGTLLQPALSCYPANSCFTGGFCGAATGCRQQNTSACGIPWCTLAAGGGTFEACYAAGLWRDTDGDGIPDAAEALGFIDNNCNGVYDPGIDIPLPGADPNKPDIYLHCDYTYASDHDHNPPPQAIQYIVDAFAAHGMNLHIDPQHNAISESIARVVTLANPAVAACTGPNAISITQLRQQSPYLQLLKPIYHYMVFGHYASCDPAVDPNTGLPYCSACPNDPENPSCGSIVPQPPQPDNLGTGEIFGNDAIVATAGFADAGLPTTMEAWAGLAMHELGHLGLEHGGQDCYNRKPNYVSVMNYNFYTLGIPVAALPGSVVPKSCSSDADCLTPNRSGALFATEGIEPARVEPSSLRFDGAEPLTAYLSDVNGDGRPDLVIVFDRSGIQPHSGALQLTGRHQTGSAFVAEVQAHSFACGGVR